MAAGVTLKCKRKAGAFVNGELAAGEWGLDVTAGEWYFSANGTTVLLLAPGGGGLTFANVGGMFSGNTETGITATFQAGDDTIDLVVGALNTLPAPLADLAMAGFKITGLGTPTASTDAVTKAYVDALAEGLDWKNSVRVATTAPGTLATSFADGQTVDGVVLDEGDRILIKDQAAGADNGIYTVNAAGAPTRAQDANTSAEVTGGMATFVNEGTTNANTAWTLTTNDPITLGTTALVFVQLFALAQHTHNASDINAGDLATARMQTNVAAALDASGAATVDNANLIFDGGTL